MYIIHSKRGDKYEWHLDLLRAIWSRQFLYWKHDFPVTMWAHGNLVFIAGNGFPVCCLKCSLMKSWAGPSLPQSLTTKEEHRTTFLFLPSASNLQRTAYSPNWMLSCTVKMGIWFLWHRASTRFLYGLFLQFSAKMQKRGPKTACFLFKALMVW